MAKLESALSLDQILDGIRHLSEQEQRALAAAVLADPSVESFVEELDDSLSCERAGKEGPPDCVKLEDLKTQSVCAT
jgi:hypothetical protein